MKRYWTLCVLALMLAGPAALAAPAVSSASTTITLQNDNTYTPSSATLDLGDGSFDWEWGPGGVGTIELHNVLQDAQLFSSGEPTKSDPDGFSVTASAGSFPYFCQIHLGMEGDVNVRPVLGASDTGQGPIPVAWATTTTSTGDTYDVRYRTGKKWKSWKKDTSKLSGTFGRNKKPAKVKSGRSYRFQARSKSGNKRRSDWSPELVVDR